VCQTNESLKSNKKIQVITFFKSAIIFIALIKAQGEESCERTQARGREVTVIL
jgi:hypothetical protein